MQIYNSPAKSTWQTLANRPQFNTKTLNAQVQTIFDEIIKNKDKAVQKYTQFFDQVSITEFRVSEDQLKAATAKISKELQEAIKLAKQNIETFHLSQQENKQVIETTSGVFCWRESRAIQKVGIYIPGGTAPLFSTVLMLGIPAKIAGCQKIVLCSPPNKQGEIAPEILFAAQLIGITDVFCVGGIQAIGALTFGTVSIPQVDKIFGPGNQFVTAAKQMAQNYGVAIDMPAGPSELLVIADSSCPPAFVAADLLSQAEHGSDSQVILLSHQLDSIEAVISEVQTQLNSLPRKDMAAKALNNSRFICLDSIADCLEFSNNYAPEHLILAFEDYQNYTHKITNAGSVFLGPYSCESAGDYASGTNHTLPTNGFARNYSGVSLDSFIKKITFQELTSQGLQNIGPAIELMAEAEQLMAHKNAVTIRLNNL